MRYTPPPSALFIRNRQRLQALLPPSAMVVVHANDQMPTNADGVMPFVQNSSFYYLSGIEQEKSILLLFADATVAAFREILFLQPSTPELTTWEGEKLTSSGATQYSGIATIKPLTAFDNIFHQLACQADMIYLESNEHYRAEVVVQSRNAHFITQCQKKYPLHTYKRVAPLLAQLRAVKAADEIHQLQRACALTKAGFEAALQVIKPGCKEYEVEAAYLHRFVAAGSKGFAYSPIIASGAHACVLHYTQNAATCQAGDLLLMDVGAEYGNYYADMTRCVPVSGTFSARQRVVYDAVLDVLRYAKRILRPGVIIADYQRQVEKAIEEKLCELGLLTPQQIKAQDPKHPLHKQYFMHGVSHHLGLDVHDIPLMHTPLQAGAVLTVEPGIYIQEEGIGVRLENDIRITDTGVEDLMADIPIEADEIEQRMAARKN